MRSGDCNLSYKRVLLAGLALLHFSSIGFTQKSVADSFMNIATTSAVDSVQIDAYREAAIELVETDTDKSIQMALLSLNKAVGKNDLNRKARAAKTLGVAYDIKGNLDSCLFYLNDAFNIFGILQKKDWQSHVLSDIAIAYFYRGNYELALRNNLTALNLRRKLGDKSFISKSLNNIGALYRARKDYKNAISSYQESLQIKRELKDEQGRLNTMMNIGALYQNDGKYDSALLYGKQAVVMAESLHSTEDIAGAKANIGAALLNLGRTDEALMFLKEADRLNTENNFTANHFTVYEAMGDVYMTKKEYPLAQQYFQKGLVLSEEKQRKESEKVFNKKLARSYSAIGNYQLAFEHQLESDRIDDELLNDENLRQLNEMTQVYQTAEREKEIAALNIQGEVDKKVILTRKRERNYFIAAAIIFMVMAFFAWKAFRSNKKKKEQLDLQNHIIEKSLEEKEVLMKEIHHRVKNNLQVISSLLDLQSMTIKDNQAYEAVKEGKNRVQSMALIHQNLYSEGNLKGIIAREYIDNLLRNLCDSYNISSDKVTVHTQIDDLNLDVDTMIPLGLIINELVSNSFKYAFKNVQKGQLNLVLQQQPGYLLLKVSDNGTGFPDGFDTKGNKSFGLKMIKAFAQKLKAKLDIYNNNGAVVEMQITKYNMA
jgi:two-component sensor histidine kinase